VTDADRCGHRFWCGIVAGHLDPLADVLGGAREDRRYERPQVRERDLLQRRLWGQREWQSSFSDRLDRTCVADAMICSPWRTSSSGPPSNGVVTA
jgi:hypothetical protein